MNPCQSETKFSIRLNRSSNSFRLKACFGFIRIVASNVLVLGRIDFLPFFIKRDTKSFLDWFGMICIGSDTDIGMNRNSSDWFRMNSYPILSPGKSAEGIKFKFFPKQKCLDRMNSV